MKILLDPPSSLPFFLTRGPTIFRESCPGYLRAMLKGKFYVLSLMSGMSAPIAPGASFPSPTESPVACVSVSFFDF